MKTKLNLITKRLKDERTKKILIVSHCILNENTRYLGGAFCSGINPDILKELSIKNCGIVQLPCPEQIAWGGVLKKLIWLPVDTKGKLINYLIRLIYPFFIWYTYFIYHRIALKTVRLIEDYLKSDFEVIGIVGIDGSPTCGVSISLNMYKLFEYHSELSIESLNRVDYNNNLYNRCSQNGKGIFIKQLNKLLTKRRINIKLYSLSLQDEKENKSVSLGIED
jgi:predicted secreted protein